MDCSCDKPALQQLFVLTGCDLIFGDNIFLIESPSFGFR